MVHLRTRQAVAAATAAALLFAGCTDDGGADDGATSTEDEDGQAADGDGTDGEDGDGEVADGDQTDDTSDAEQVPEDAPEPVSVVTVEPIDAPRSSAEIRVGEIIVEFDGRVTDEGTILTLEEPILFDFDSAQLRSGADDALDDIAEVLAYYEGAPVEVIGHTDDVGSREYNLELSTNRAQAVLDALTRRGIPADRITSEGRAFDDPIASNDTEEGQAQNRRVEVLIVGVEPPTDEG